jgi:TRAP-type uncharacterized transport system fused permease subunit
MLLVGAIMLSIWSSLNVILALGILFTLLVIGNNAPATTILFSGAEVNQIEARALATINSVAVFGNACAASLCALILFVIWGALVQKLAWAFWALVISMCFVQTMGFASDALLGNKNLIANIVSSGILVVGLSLSTLALLSKRCAPHFKM